MKFSYKILNFYMLFLFLAGNLTLKASSDSLSTEHYKRKCQFYIDRYYDYANTDKQKAKEYLEIARDSIKKYKRNSGDLKQYNPLIFEIKKLEYIERLKRDNMIENLTALYDDRSGLRRRHSIKDEASSSDSLSMEHYKRKCLVYIDRYYSYADTNKQRAKEYLEKARVSIKKYKRNSDDLEQYQYLKFKIRELEDSERSRISLHSPEDYPITPVIKPHVRPIDGHLERELRPLARYHFKRCKEYLNDYYDDPKVDEDKARELLKNATAALIEYRKSGGNQEIYEEILKEIKSQKEHIRSCGDKCYQATRDTLICCSPFIIPGLNFLFNYLKPNLAK
ncbi:MAG: hypothetical protein IBJ00_01080 [Alphaproteobacteria bacterium]|nr:hypothetical protein [Alphaproteobacteria bacterium]